jgi:antirestriction protein ArdC
METALEPEATVWQVITDRVIAALEAGVIPWRRPWSGAETAPANLVSGRRYNSWINRMMFGLSSFASFFWLTRGQALNLGGEIPEGEEPTPVISIWWRQVEVNNQKFRLVPKYRYCPVYNYEQCRGLKKIPKVPVVKTFAHDPIAAAEAIVAAMPDPPAIEDGGGRAAYDLIRDVVLMPKPEHFKRRADYYKVLFHELAHSTSHKRRLERFTIHLSHNRKTGTIHGHLFL